MATIWFDLSDMLHWPHQHLTGIQRVVLGVWSGLRELGVSIRCVAYMGPKRGFVEIDPASLPPAVRRHVPGLGEASPPVWPSEPSPLRTDRQGMRHWLRWRLLGDSDEAEMLGRTLLQLAVAARTLPAAALRWAPVRLRHGLRPSPSRGAAVAGKDPFAPGDVVLALGATWTVPGHAEALAGSKARVLWMVYDLIPILRPHWVSTESTEVFRKWLSRVVTTADQLVTISHHSRSELQCGCQQQALPCPPVTVVRLADALADTGLVPVEPAFQPQRPFFLCVCTLDPRKNQRLLIDAWELLAADLGDACPDLLLVGLAHPHTEPLLREIASHPQLQQRVRCLHAVPDSDLNWYYRQCVATLYPSRYEGWGLPVAESLAWGKLCIASNATSIPEISATLPLFHDPLDPYAIVAAVRRCLLDPDWLAGREADIRANYRPTHWRETAAEVLAVITSGPATVSELSQ